MDGTTRIGEQEGHMKEQEKRKKHSDNSCLPFRAFTLEQRSRIETGFHRVTQSPQDALRLLIHLANKPSFGFFAERRSRAVPFAESQSATF